MSVMGIRTASYPVTGYPVKRAGKNVSSGDTGFMEAVAEKAGQPETAKETGVNGLGMNGRNGMLTHISQMMVQRLNKVMKGTGGENDILGSTVQSAIRATEQALYDLDHPLVPEGLKSIEVQRQQMKERMFYQSFLDKLGALVNEGFAGKDIL